MHSLETFENFRRRNPRSNSDYSFFSNRINQVGDRYWFFEIASKATRTPYKIFDWVAQYRELSAELIILGQEYLLKAEKGYTNPDTGRFVFKSTTGFTNLSAARYFFQLMSSNFPTVQSWKSVPVDKLLRCITTDLADFRSRAEREGCLKPSSGFSHFHKNMRMLRNFGGIARNISPFSSLLSAGIPSTELILKEYLDGQEIPYSSFRPAFQGIGIPFHIASAWLSFILQELNSDSFKIWQAHWIFVREYSARHDRKETLGVAHWLEIVEAIYRYQGESYYFSSGKQKQNHDFRVAVFHKAFNKTLGYVPSMEKVIETTSTTIQRTRHNILVDYIRHLYAALAMATGARRCELNYIQLSDFEEQTDRASNFRSFIHKTNAGLPTIRSIAGFAHELASRCADLGPIDRREDGVYLFYTDHTASTRPKHLGGQAAYFNQSYQLFLQSLPDDLAQEFRKELPSVNLHQARHLFAAFALRVSDGNVFEAIRKHFRHALGSQMTKAYTDHKISGDEAASVEKEYIKEIIQKIGNKEDHGYFGPMVVRIEQLIDKYIKFWDLKELKKLNEKIEEVADRFHAVKVHEWGLCVTPESSLTKSKCYNKTTRLPDYDKGSTFNNCASCIHLLSHHACKEDIERIGISAFQTLNQYPILGNTLRMELEKTIRQVNSLLTQLEKGSNR